jgi:hypothetical protein
MRESAIGGGAAFGDQPGGHPIFAFARNYTGNCNFVVELHFVGL